MGVFLDVLHLVTGIIIVIMGMLAFVNPGREQRAVSSGFFPGGHIKRRQRYIRAEGSYQNKQKEGGGYLSSWNLRRSGGSRNSQRGQHLGVKLHGRNESDEIR